MTISFVGVSANAQGTTTVSIPYVAGAASDCIVAVIANKAYSSTPTQANYAATGSIASGTTASGADTGSIRASAFRRNTSPTGAANDAFAITAGTISFGRSYRFAKDAGKAWDVQTFTLADTDETGTTVSASVALSPGDIMAGDMLVYNVAIKSDAPNHTSQSFVIDGVTIGTDVPAGKQTTTLGDDLSIYPGYFDVTAGDSSGNLTYTATSSVSGASAVAVTVTRLREVDAHPVGRHAAGSVLRSTNGGTTVSPVWPTNSVDDCALMFVGSTVAIDTPAGWDKLGETTTPASARATVFWKHLASTDSGGEAITHAAGNSGAVIYTYTGASTDPPDPADFVFIPVTSATAAVAATSLDYERFGVLFVVALPAPTISLQQSSDGTWYWSEGTDSISGGVPSLSVTDGPMSRAGSRTLSATLSSSVEHSIFALALKAPSSGRTPVTASFAMSWSVRAQVTKSVGLLWGVRATVAMAAALGWSVRTTVSKSAALSWTVRAAVTKAAAISWTVRSIVSKTTALAWSVRSVVTRAEPISWSVRSSVTLSSPVSWSVRATVAKSVPVVWSVRELVARALSISWGVEALADRTSVTVSLPISWTARAQVTVTADLRWSVRAQVTKVAAVRWAVRSIVTSAVVVSWSVRSAVTRAAALSWSARSLVARAWTILWGVEAVAESRNLTLVAEPFPWRWSTASLEHRWETDGTAGRFRVDALGARFTTASLSSRFKVTEGI